MSPLRSPLRHWVANLAANQEAAIAEVGEEREGSGGPHDRQLAFERGETSASTRFAIPALLLPHWPSPGLARARPRAGRGPAGQVGQAGALTKSVACSTRSGGEIRKPCAIEQPRSRTIPKLGFGRDCSATTSSESARLIGRSRRRSQRCWGRGRDLDEAPGRS